MLVSKLRGLLADAGVDGANVLTSAFGCYRLDLPEGSWVDVIVAADAAEEAEEALAGDDLEQAKTAAAVAAAIGAGALLARRGRSMGGGEAARARRRPWPRAEHSRRGMPALRRRGGGGEVGRAGDRACAVSRSRVPASDGGACRRRQSSGGAPGVRAVPAAARGGARRLPVARDRVDLPRPPRSAAAPRPSGGVSRAAEPTGEHPSAIQRGTGRRRPPRVAGGGSCRARLRRDRDRGQRRSRRSCCSRGRSRPGGAPASPPTRSGSSTRARAARAARSRSGRSPSARRRRRAARSGSRTPTGTASRGSTPRRRPSSRRSRSATARAGSRSAAAPSGWPTASTARSRGSTRGTNTRRADDRRRKRPARDRLRGRLGLGREHRRRHDHEDRRRQRQADEDAPIAATELAFGAGTLWASERAAGRVVRIDPTTGSRSRAIHVGNGPTGIAFGGGAAWVANSLDGTVSRIDPDDELGRARPIPTGNGPTAIARRRARRLGQQPVRRHARRGSIRGRTRWRSRSASATARRASAIADGNVLVSRPPVRRRPSRRHAHGADEPRRSTRSTPPSPTTDLVADPAHDERRPRRVQPGERPRGNAARARPRRLAPGPDRRRQDIHVPAAAEHPLLERQAGQGVRLPRRVRARLRDRQAAGVQYYDGIVGAARCEQEPKRCDLSRGIVADDAARTVTFHLVAPDPEFLVQARAPLRLRRARGDAAERGRHAPAAGDRAVHDRELPARGTRSGSCATRTSTNGRKPRSPTATRTRSSSRSAAPPDAAVDDVIHGKADAFSTSQSENPPPRSCWPTLRTRYASQVHTNPQPATIALFLNTRVAPFNRLDVRRALNYAADRAAAVRLVGGPDVAQADLPDPAAALPRLPALLPLHGRPSADGTGRRRTSPRRARSSPARARAA